jgi:2-oxoglutarate ferredoxin oxidoreductase subunit beta
VSLALGAGATFVARSIDRDKQHLPAMLRAAAAHPGAALVEILQNCPVFNDDAFDHLTDKAQAAVNRIDLVHGRPIVFGPEGERCVVRTATGALRVAATADVVPEGIVVHDVADEALAFGLSRLGDLTAGALPLGVFRDVPGAVWGEGLATEQRATHAQLGTADLDALLREADTWTVA